MKPCRIYLVSTVQTSFWGSGERQYEKRFIPRMEQLAAELHFELTCQHEIVTSEAEARAARDRIRAGSYDLLLIQVSTFADGNIITPLAQAGPRIGLWAVPEITRDGAIPNNSFCGINMYASILHQYIDRGLAYKWFFGDVDDPLFIDRLRVTVSALSALRSLQGARVGLIGGIAPGFNDLYYDERQTRKALDVTVDRTLEFSDVKDRALAYTPEQIAPIVAEIRAESTRIADDMTDFGLENTARVYKAFEDIVREQQFDAIAISCWPRFRKELGIVVCSVIGRLLQNGIVAACEGDVDSAISMLMLTRLTGVQPMLMDLSKPDFQDDSVLMWHCGSAPRRYADSSGVTFDGHYKPGSRVTCMDNIRVSGVNNMYYAAQPVTIARFTDDYRGLLTFSGSFLAKQDHGYDGSRGWVGDMTMDGQPLSSLTLANTILSRGLQHHFPIVSGHVEAEVREIAAWLGVTPVEPVPYRPYLQIHRG
mgnify:FL=1